MYTFKDRNWNIAAGWKERQANARCMAHNTHTREGLSSMNQPAQFIIAEVLRIVQLLSSGPRPRV